MSLYELRRLRQLEEENRSSSSWWPILSRPRHDTSGALAGTAFLRNEPPSHHMADVIQGMSRVAKPAVATSALAAATHGKAPSFWCTERWLCEYSVAVGMSVATNMATASP